MKPAWSSPRTSLASCSGVAISMTVTRAPGLAARKRARQVGKKLKVAGPIAARRNSPVWPAAASRARFTAVSALANTCRDSRKKIAPASVSATRLRSRSSRRKPSSSLKVADLCAQGRLREVQLHRRAAEAEPFCDGDEVTQMTQFHGWRAYSFCLSRAKQQSLI